jgi:hypothetical protein
VFPTTGVDAVENREILPLHGMEPRLLGRPAHSLVIMQTDSYEYELNSLDEL